MEEGDMKNLFDNLDMQDAEHLTNAIEPLATEEKNPNAHESFSADDSDEEIIKNDDVRRVYLGERFSI